MISVLLAAMQPAIAVAFTPVAWLGVAVFAWLAADAVLAPRRRSERVVALGGTGDDAVPAEPWEADR